MTYTPFVWLLLISAFINGAVAYQTRHYQEVPSVRSFRFLMRTVAVWALLYGVETLIVDVSFKLLTISVIYIPTLLSVIAVLMLALDYTGQREWLTRRRLVLLCFPQIIFVIAAFTTQYHQLWLYDIQLQWMGSLPVLIMSEGVIYWIFVAYMVGISLATTLILITSFRYRTLYFRNTVLLTIGMLVPVIVGVLYVFELTPIRGFDWTPTSFIITGTLYIWAVLRGRLFDVTPLARKTLIEHLDDLMIVLNKKGLIVDFNRAAQAALALSPSTIGLSPSALPQPWAEIFQSHVETDSSKVEVEAYDHIYELDITPIQDDLGVHGRIFLFRDISQRKKIEESERRQRVLAEALRDTAQALTGTLDFDQVLEEILRNAGRVVPTDSANIALLDEDGSLRYAHYYGYEKHQISAQELETVKFSLATSKIFQKVFDTGEPLILPDTRANADWIVTESGAWIRSYAVMPLRLKQKVIGFLNLDSATQGLYLPEHLHALRAFADQAAIAVENARLFATASHEIEERKQAEKSLQDSEKRFRALVEVAPLGILLTHNARIMYANDALLDLFHDTFSDVLGVPTVEKVAPEDRAQFAEHVKKQAEGQKMHYEIMAQRRDGSKFPVQVDSTRVTDVFEEITAIGFVQDISNRRAAEEITKEQNERLNTLHSVTLDLLNRRNIDDVLNAILLRGSELFDAPFGLLSVLKDGMLEVQAASEMAIELKGWNIPLEKAKLSGLCVDTREPQVVQNYSEWAQRLSIHDPFQLGAVANVPLIINDEVIGILAFGRTKPNHPYSQDDIHIIGSLGQLAALAIDNARLFATAQNELAEKIHAEQELRDANQVLQFQLEAIEHLQAELREQAIRDPLTGMYNRRYLDETLDHEMARASREGYPISFVMIDIDHFKQVNDTFGHDAGDRMLQKLAGLLLGQTRPGDIVCRYGGEEILVVIPNTSAEAAFQITERWRLSFIGTTLPLDFGTAKTTLSCGISEFSTHGTSATDLISFADKAMYQAKSAGRNRVWVWQVYQGTP